MEKLYLERTVHAESLITSVSTQRRNSIADICNLSIVHYNPISFLMKTENFFPDENRNKSLSKEMSYFYKLISNILL